MTDSHPNPITTLREEITVFGSGCREEGKCLLCVDFPKVLWLVNQKGLGGQILFGSSQHLNLLRQEWLKPERGVLYQVSPDHCVA